ncbi:MAG: SDR family NAD(P)-dependent oxidoreductase [Actinobacteria bacterium]|jgi:meso-butanediol dehydrogenase/(S,S)-butanediol dehydrogenase/diacetyl reductase|nr:SDR family NAD(P)-dependent oxidoreductase [Actinomycetota bacterium]
MNQADLAVSFQTDGVAVVTGAAQGIGQAAAVALAQQGADVACVDRDADRCAETVALVEGLGRKALAIGCDVSSRAEVDAAAERIVAELGPITYLATCAGVLTENVTAEDVKDEDLDTLWSVNVKGSFNWAIAASRSMIPAGRGSIVLISSQAGLVSLPSQAGYSMSKGAVATMARSLAIDWAKHGLTVNALCPTFIWTPMAAPMLEIPEVHAAAIRRIPLGRVGQPRDIGGVVAFLCSPAASLITGVVLPVDGGWTAGEPELPL